MAEILAMPGVEGLLAVDDDADKTNHAQEGKNLAGVAGFVIWRVVAGEAEILTICVLPPWRKVGVGSILLERAMAQASLNATQMFLEVDTRNASAIALYTKHKFTRTGLRRGYYQGFDAFVMARDLAITTS